MCMHGLGSDIAAALTPVLLATSGIAAIYLFGSALAEMRPDSDIDLGIVPSPGADPFQVVGDIEGLTPRVNGHAVHATVLDGRDTLFTFEVLSKGEIIHCSDEDTLTDLIERVSRCYADVGPPYDRALREIFGPVDGEVPGGQSVGRV